MINYPCQMRMTLCSFLAVLIQMYGFICAKHSYKNRISYQEIKQALAMWSYNGLVVPSGSYCDLLAVFCIENGNLSRDEKAELKSSPVDSFCFPLICNFIVPSSRQEVFKDLSALLGMYKDIELLSILFISVIYQEISYIELHVQNSLLSILVLGRNETKLLFHSLLRKYLDFSLLNLSLFIHAINEAKKYTKNILNTKSFLTPEWVITTLVYGYLKDEISYIAFLTSTCKFCYIMDLPTERLFARNREVSHEYMAILDDVVDLIRTAPGITKIVPLVETTEFIPTECSYTGVKAMSYILNILGDYCFPSSIMNNDWTKRIENILKNSEPTSLRMVYEQILIFLNGEVGARMDIQKMHTRLVHTIIKGVNKSANMLDRKKTRIRINNRMVIQIFEENNSISADVLGECKSLFLLSVNPRNYEELKRNLFLQGKRLEYLIMCLVTNYAYRLSTTSSISN